MNRKPKRRIHPVKVYLTDAEHDQLNRLRTKASSAEPATASSILRHAIKQYAMVQGV